MTEYIALIHKDQHSSLGASFPDLPGCISAADSLEDLRPMIEESLSLHIEGLLEDGDALPEPSTLDAIVKSKDFADAVAVMVVKSPEAPDATVHVNITLPEKNPRPNRPQSRPKRHVPLKLLGEGGGAVVAAPKGKRSFFFPSKRETSSYLGY
jgi:predicted RNase H-like HicB family nuclease